MMRLSKRAQESGFSMSNLGWLIWASIGLILGLLILAYAKGKFLGTSDWLCQIIGIC